MSRCEGDPLGKAMPEITGDPPPDPYWSAFTKKWRDSPNWVRAGGRKIPGHYAGSQELNRHNPLAPSVVFVFDELYEPDHNREQHFRARIERQPDGSERIFKYDEHGWPQVYWLVTFDGADCTSVVEEGCIFVPYDPIRYTIHDHAEASPPSDERKEQPYEYSPVSDDDEDVDVEEEVPDLEMNKCYDDDDFYHDDALR